MQRPSEVTGVIPLGAGVVVVSHLTWILGSKSGSSARVVCALSH